MGLLFKLPVKGKHSNQINDTVEENQGIHQPQWEY